MNEKQVKEIYDYTIEKFLNRLRKKGEVGQTVADIIEKGLLEGLDYHSIDHLIYSYIENLQANLVNVKEIKEVENIIFSLLKAKEDLMLESE